MVRFDLTYTRNARERLQKREAVRLALVADMSRGQMPNSGTSSRWRNRLARTVPVRSLPTKGLDWLLHQRGLSRNSPSSSARHLMAPTGCTRSNSMAIECTPGSMPASPNPDTPRQRLDREIPGHRQRHWRIAGAKRLSGRRALPCAARWSDGLQPHPECD
jgi:hypothetical protein